MVDRTGDVAGGGGAGAPPADMPTMGLPIQPMPVGDDVVTLGVSIEVPEPYGPELQRWRVEFGDPLGPVVPAHVTLLPPTAVPPELADAVVAHLADVASATEPFTVRLRGTATFRPVSPVVFVALYQGAAGCDALQQRIRTGPLRRDLSFPYHPHVTVAHHLADPALDRAQTTLRDYEADFLVDGLTLYEHGRDGVWRPRRRFAFGGRPS